MTTVTKPTRAIAQKVLEVISHGLTKGQGQPKPGEMCVEAAVCYALGLHSDDPPCVGYAVRSFKIALNDAAWSSDAARAKGLRRIAIAQLGSNEIDQAVFVKELARLTIRKIVPLALRATASIHPRAQHKEALEAAAVNCEEKADLNSARMAQKTADAAYAADAAAHAAAAAAAYAAHAAYAAAHAADAADAAAAAAAAADAAYAADAAHATYDRVLSMMAEIGVEALQFAGSPGCQWLDLCPIEG